MASTSDSGVATVYLELYDRIPPLASDAVEGLDASELVWAPEAGANTIAWLIWHVARVQDHHVSELLDEPQLWQSGPWAANVGLEPDPSNTGYGHRPADVRKVHPTGPESLLEYLDAVYRRTRPMLEGLSAAAIERVVDRRWDPPVTLGVRLVSVADDSLQHVGQAAYIRGLLGSAS
jgi:hypothetical protein